MKELEEGSCERPPDEPGETYCEANINVNLEEKKNQLFKIARNTELDLQSSLNQLREELEGLRDEDLKTLMLTKDEKGNTALHCAAKAGNLKICQILVDRGADLNATGENGMKILPFAARYGDEKRVEEVWKCMKWIVTETKKLDLKKQRKSRRKKQPKSNEEEIEMQVQNPETKGELFFDAKDKDKYNFNILHHAIQNTNWAKNPMVVQRLIETGKFPITDTDHQGNTCLHLAAQFDKQGDDKIFDAFFESEQRVDAEITKCIKKRNDRGMTPIHIACAVGNEETLRDLIKISKENSIDVKSIVNSHDKNGVYPICNAINTKNHEMVNMLLREGSNVVQDTMLRAARYYRYI